MHLPFIAVFYYLNLYLHCGYYIPFLEWLLPKFWINTSDWHNLHHALRVSHFGEMLTLWDHIMDTHSKNWSKERLEDTTKAIVVESDIIRGVNSTKHSDKSD